MITELVQRVFATRNAVHLEHWRTKSFSQHSALGDLYDQLINAIDPIVEAHQGVFDLIKVDDLPKQPKVIDLIGLLEDDLTFINKNRKYITSGLPAIDNLLQTLEGHYMTALYKLKRLS